MAVYNIIGGIWSEHYKTPANPEVLLFATLGKPES